MDIIRKSIKIKIITLILIWIHTCYSIEQYQREIYLAPRNYNPHPYEQLAKIQNPGPVLFPVSDDDDQNNNRYNIVTVDNSKINNDISPYARVTQKIKYLLSSRQYSSKRHHNQIDADIYNALADQGAKVLAYPPQELKHYGRSSALKKKNYAFSYKVLDKATGDDFSHQQIRSSKATNGEYRVKLPDGRLQIVSYKADKNGYKADVKYEVDPEATYQQQEYIPQKVVSEQAPVRQSSRDNHVNNYEYIAVGEQEQQLVSPLRDSNIVVLEQNGPTQTPGNYVDIPRSQTHSPVYLINDNQQAQYYPNQVQIYTNNPRDHAAGNFVSTTPASPVIRYTSTPVPPTVQAQVIHPGDHGLYNPNLVAPPGHKNVINTIDSKDPNDSYRQTFEQENELPEGIYIVGKSGKR
ncbi:unnamed protein product [Ceutorhynchus assimilis]|uniref:Uncharacterized protein n=1 Tax=Ceutorhynchus assimilis TaxID=467358 RepID=A0A9N9MN92_9CUCU|nr:unnamed protein product [Ceutorhynchus assimilis]